jgi:hypothetical protein
MLPLDKRSSLFVLFIGEKAKRVLTLTHEANVLKHFGGCNLANVHYKLECLSLASLSSLV